MCAITTEMVVSALVTAVASGAASYAVSEFSGANARAKEQAKLAKERAAMEDRQRELQAARERATAQRQARQRGASAANLQAAQGALFSSSALGIQHALASNLDSAMTFAEATGANSRADSALKGRQIDLQRDANLNYGVGAGFEAGFKNFGANAGEDIGKGISDWFSNSMLNWHNQGVADSIQAPFGNTDNSLFGG